MSDDVATNLNSIRNKISELEKKYHRDAGSVKLLAVSKAQPLYKIETAYNAGQKDFAENYLQEALQKITALSDKDITWHFIGSVQSNKTKQIANSFSWVHSVSRELIAKRLDEARDKSFGHLNVCIEVNIDQEETKAGVNIDNILPLAKYISTCENLKLRGLMAIPKHSDNFEVLCAGFKKLVQAQERLNQNGFNLDTLSMGMSSDFEAAIASGSTMVRIGTAIFGARSS